MPKSKKARKMERKIQRSIRQIKRKDHKEEKRIIKNQKRKQRKLANIAKYVNSSLNVEFFKDSNEIDIVDGNFSNDKNEMNENMDIESEIPVEEVVKNIEKIQINSPKNVNSNIKSDRSFQKPFIKSIVTPDKKVVKVFKDDLEGMIRVSSFRYKVYAGKLKK